MVPKYIITDFTLSRSMICLGRFLPNFYRKSHLNIIQYKEETEMSRPYLINVYIKIFLRISYSFWHSVIIIISIFIIRWGQNIFASL